MVPARAAASSSLGERVARAAPRVNRTGARDEAEGFILGPTVSAAPLDTRARPGNGLVPVLPRCRDFGQRLVEPQPPEPAIP